MGFITLLLIALGLAMDAFSVSVCKGLAGGKKSPKLALLCGLWFGFFQALMPVIGYFLGSTFAAKIAAVDHWIAFILLALIGGNMIREALSKEEEEEATATAAPAEMLMLAIATSIDALAVGVTFAFMETSIWLDVAVIGLVTFVTSFAGVYIGSIFGEKYSKRAEIAGGIILILIGFRILLTDLGVL